MDEITIDQITKRDYEVYEMQRMIGSYNMFDAKARELTGLSKEMYVAIMKNYGALMEKYPGVRRN